VLSRGLEWAKNWLSRRPKPGPPNWFFIKNIHPRGKNNKQNRFFSGRARFSRTLATTSHMGIYISPVIRVFPWGPRELNCARPLGVPGCYITCRGCLSRYITALVPLLHVLTTSCSRTADIRAPCGQRQLGAYLAGRPFPGSQGQTGRCHRTHRTALLRRARGCVGLAGHQWAIPRPLVAGA